MQNNFISCLCLLFILLLVNQTGECKSLISSSSCIIGSKNPSKSNVITVGTVGSQCNSTCQTYCSEKFKLTITSSDDSTSNTNDSTSNTNNSSTISRARDVVFQVNQDRIESCLKHCYNSQPTSTKIRVPIQINANGNTYNDFGDTPEPWVCDVYPSSKVKNALDLSCKDTSNSSSTDGDNVCSASAFLESYADGNITLTQDQKIIISIVDYNQKSGEINDNLINIDGNNIYLCGFKTVMFSTNYHYHAPGINKPDKVYNASETGISIFDPTIHTSKQPLKTNVFVKNKDYLSMKYMGKYYSNCKDKGGCVTDTISDYQINIMRDNQKLTFQVPEIQIKDYSNAKQNYIAGKANCKTCITNPNDRVCMNADCGYIKPNTNKINGLQTSVIWINSPKLFATQLGTDDSESQFRNTTIFGTVDSLSEKLSELIISYPYNQNDNHPKGGYFVSMTWRGCHYQDGERLEYIVLNDAILNSQFFSQYINAYAEWKPLGFSTINGVKEAEITVTKADLVLPSVLGIEDDDLVKSNDKGNAKIYFRIKTISDSEAKEIGATDFLRSDTVGQYYLRIDKPITNSPLTSFIEKFEKFLDKISEKIFKGFTTNKTFISIIRLLLVFYIGFLGIMFISGIAPLNQKEGVVRIFKVAVVLMLLSDNSFTFFNDYFFTFFSFETMNNVANIFTTKVDVDITAGITDDSAQSCLTDKTQKIYLLCVLQQDLNILFSWGFWNRMFGFLISGFLVPAIAITIGVLMYATIALKVVFLYCMAMLSLTVTLALSPIFIPLILFKYTKGIFDNWIKQLMVLVLQPMFVFTAISLFRIIFLVLIQTFMGTSACKMCWLEFSLPSGSYCLFDGYFYVPLSLGSSPGVFSLPVTNLGLLISLFFIGSGMQSFCAFSYELAKKMINPHSFAVSSYAASPSSMFSQAKQSAAMVYSAAKMPLKVLAIDDKSRADRASMRAKTYKKHADKEEKKQEKEKNNP